MSLDRISDPGRLRNAAGLGWTEDAPTRRLLAADWRLDYADFDQNAEKTRSAIFFGGPIITVNDEMPEVEAMAIKDGKIVALGDRKKVFESHTARTRMIDLEGRALMPGFIDPHVHLAWTAATRYRWLNVSPLATPRRQQMLDAIGEVANNKTAGEWVLAFGYDPSRLAPGEAPLTAEELDKVSMANPIFVMAQSSEVAYVNHRGLEMVSAQMPRANGCGHELTGELLGAASFTPFFETFPPFTFEEKLKDCTRLVREWARKGCTTVYDAGVGALWGQEEVRLILDLASDPSTPVRLRAALVPTNNLPRVAGIRPGQGNDRLSFVGIEFTADGLEPGQRALAEPLLAKIEGGSLNHDDDDLKIRMQPWHDANWQLLVHVSGHEAVDQVLRVFESIFADSPRIKHRHRIDGCESIDEDQLALAQQLGLSISHLIGYAGVGEKLGDRGAGARADSLIPLAWDPRLGVTVSLHSDSPSTSVEPLQYLQTAVTRMMRESREGLEIDHRIIMQQALKMITLYPAYQCFLDDRVGSLAVGKVADLVVLDRDPRRIDPSRIAGIEVLDTYLDGVSQSYP